MTYLRVTEESQSESDNTTLVSRLSDTGAFIRNHSLSTIFGAAVGAVTAAIPTAAFGTVYNIIQAEGVSSGMSALLTAASGYFLGGGVILATAAAGAATHFGGGYLMDKAGMNLNRWNSDFKVRNAVIGGVVGAAASFYAVAGGTVGASEAQSLPQNDNTVPAASPVDVNSTSQAYKLTR